VGARFFSQVQTGPGPHPASCTMGTGSFPGVKRPGRCADHPTPPSAEIENESRPLVACYRVTFTFYHLSYVNKSGVINNEASGLANTLTAKGNVVNVLEGIHYICQDRPTAMQHPYTR
jgi:hypothetical protein